MKSCVVLLFYFQVHGVDSRLDNTYKCNWNTQGDSRQQMTASNLEFVSLSLSDQDVKLSPLASSHTHSSESHPQARAQAPDTYLPKSNVPPLFSSCLCHRRQQSSASFTTTPTAPRHTKPTIHTPSPHLSTTSPKHLLPRLVNRLSTDTQLNPAPPKTQPRKWPT